MKQISLIMRCLLAFGALAVSVSAFGVSRRQPTVPIARSTMTTTLFLSDENQGSGPDIDRMRALGYSEDEIRRSAKDSTDKAAPKVRVDLVEDVDSFTLTAIGFALIALNFFVFANMGDGGIGGVVATIMNTMNQ